MTEILLKNFKLIVANPLFFWNFILSLLLWLFTLFDSPDVRVLLTNYIYLYTMASILVQGAIWVLYQLIVKYANIKYLIIIQRNMKTKSKHPVVVGIRFNKKQWREFLESSWVSEYEKDFALELFIEQGLFTEISSDLFEYTTEEEEEW